MNKETADKDAMIIEYIISSCGYRVLSVVEVENEMVEIHTTYPKKELFCESAPHVEPVRP